MSPQERIPPSFLGISLIQLKHDIKTKHSQKSTAHIQRPILFSMINFHWWLCFEFLKYWSRIWHSWFKRAKVFLLWKMFLHICTGVISKLYNLWLYQFHLSSSVHRWHQNYWYQSLTIFGYISSICHLSTDATKIVSAFVFSCLDDCSSLLPGCLKHLLNNHNNFKTLLFTLSWEFPKLAISLLILLLSIGCPLIHEYNTKSLLCDTTASVLLLLSTWLSSWKFTNQPTSYAVLLILPFLSFLCVAALVWSEIFFLCCTVCLEHSPLQSLIIKHTHIFQISPLCEIVSVCVHVCVRVCAHMLMEVCFDCVLFLVL